MKAWLRVSQDKRSNIEQTSIIFWIKITEIIKEVKCYSML